ncbi:MAG: hypothetical protein ABJF10_06665 [Chthoniobacter sp.]|uniref:hypothetical protein n=1 Tax=Chthoniobacter sp. TaxID=2510640 RepID=UPI0032AC4615
MSHESDPTSPSWDNLSRRAALGRVIATGLGLAGVCAIAAGPAVDAPEQTPEFMPENDYPYFGYEPQPE